MNGNEAKYLCQFRTGTITFQPIQWTVRTKRVRRWWFWFRWEYQVESEFSQLTGMDEDGLAELISQVGRQNVHFAEGNFKAQAPIPQPYAHGRKAHGVPDV